MNLPLTKFPLVPRADGRCLVDGAGQPFLYQADTAWFLLQKRTPEEAEEYFERRAAQGFNTVQLMLTGFAGLPDFEGNLPFGANHDFSAPNEAFFRHVDDVFARAAGKNLLLAVAPLWSGCCGEGWAGKDRSGAMLPMNVQGPDACRQFGHWLGNRYARFANILWILGGDNDPWNAYDEINALAEGLKSVAPHQRMTYHAASSHASTDVWPEARWLDVSMTYTYFRGFNKAWNRVQPDVYEINYAESRKEPRKPFFLGESTYEGEHDAWGSAWQVRKQAWWSVLSGGMGQAYGSVNWKQENNCREVIGLPGAESLRLLPEILYRLDSPAAALWSHLVPDEMGTVVSSLASSGYGRNDYATTAVLPDGSAALCYVPSPRPLRITGEWNRAIWIDPTTGDETEAHPVHRLVNGVPK